MNKKFSTFVAALLLLAGSFSCSDNDEPQRLSSEYKILSFTHEDLVEVDFLNNHQEIVTSHETYSLMSLIWKAGTDLTSLAPEITIPPGATITPTSGTKRDFSDQVFYTVTAEDGTRLTYVIISETENQEPVLRHASKTVKIIYAPDNGGTTNPAKGTYTYNEYSTLTVYAFPAAGYGFERWYVNGDSKGTNSPLYHIVTSDIILFAVFYPNSSYIIQALSEDTDRGTVSIDNGGVFSYGGSVKIYATPKSGYTFAGWYKNGTTFVSSSANYTYTPSPSESGTVVAKFNMTVSSISGPGIICVGSSGTFSASGATGSTYWESSSNLSNPGSGSLVSVSGLSNGAGWVRIVDSFNNQELKKVNVFIGPPTDLVVKGPTTPKPGGYVHFYVTTSSPLQSVSWSIFPLVGVRDIIENGTACSVDFSSIAQYRGYKITATATNSCGSTAASYSFTMGTYSGEYTP